jgi:glycosyltransferase involved in cell wall biosynthesis
VNVCHVANYKFPAKNAQGAQRIVEFLAKELTKCGNIVYLLLDKDSIVPPEYGKFVDKIPQNTDIVHLCGGFPEEYGLNVDKPWVTTSHGGAIDTPERMEIIRNRKDRVIFVSDFCAKMYDSNCFVHTCANPDDYVFKSKKENYFLWIASTDWGEQKGLFTSIMLAKKLGLRLKIAGGGSNQRIIDEIKRNCNDKIEYLGFVNGKEKAELIAGAKAMFMLGQILDACPLNIIESFASGTPVIASNRGSYPELVNEKVGFICNTHGDMVKAIASVGRIKPEDCLNHFLNNFTPEIAVKKHLKIYQNVLNYGRVE